MSHDREHPRDSSLPDGTPHPERSSADDGDNSGMAAATRQELARRVRLDTLPDGSDYANGESSRQFPSSPPPKPIRPSSAISVSPRQGQSMGAGSLHRPFVPPPKPQGYHSSYPPAADDVDSSPPSSPSPDSSRSSSVVMAMRIIAVGDSAESTEEDRETHAAPWYKPRSNVAVTAGPAGPRRRSDAPSSTRTAPGTAPAPQIPASATRPLPSAESWDPDPDASLTPGPQPPAAPIRSGAPVVSSSAPAFPTAAPGALASEEETLPLSFGPAPQRIAERTAQSNIEEESFEAAPDSWGEATPVRETGLLASAPPKPKPPSFPPPGTELLAAVALDSIPAPPPPAPTGSGAVAPQKKRILSSPPPKPKLVPSRQPPPEPDWNDDPPPAPAANSVQDSPTAAPPPRPLVSAPPKWVSPDAALGDISDENAFATAEAEFGAIAPNSEASSALTPGGTASSSPPIEAESSADLAGALMGNAAEPDPTRLGGGIRRGVPARPSRDSGEQADSFASASRVMAVTDAAELPTPDRLSSTGPAAPRLENTAAALPEEILQPVSVQLIDETAERGTSAPPPRRRSLPTPPRRSTPSSSSDVTATTQESGATPAASTDPNPIEQLPSPEPPSTQNGEQPSLSLSRQRKPPPPKRSVSGESPASVSAEFPRKRLRNPWWEDMFSEDFSRSDHPPTEAEVFKEASFIERSLGVQSGGIVLDLGCGGGHHSVELAARGYGVVGFDLSVYQLALAGELAQERGQKINFLQGDMREMAFEETFDGVLCWNSTFGYFEEDKNIEIAQRMFRALRPGGMMLLDVLNRDYVAAHEPCQVWFDGDSCVCMDDPHVDYITSRLRIKRSLILDDGRTRECVYSIRLYSLHELGKLLHDVGFRVCQASGHPTTPGAFFGPYSPRIIVLAQRP